MRRRNGGGAGWKALAARGLALALGTAVGGGNDRRAAAQEPRFRGEVRVEEEALVVQPPDRGFWRSDSVAPADLLVAVDGHLRRVTRAEPLAEAGRPWTLLVYVDRRLAEPETAFRATLALAKHAAELAALGTVEVVVADPAPRTVQPPTREARRIELMLADLAGAARVERDRASDRPPPAPQMLATTVRSQCDHLLVHLSGRRERGPRALFLVADGFPPAPQTPAPPAPSAPAAAAAPAAGTPAAVDSATAAAFARAAGALSDTARLLAGYGWVTLPLPLRRGDPGVAGQRLASDADRARRNSEEGGYGASVPPPITPAIVLPPRRHGTVNSLDAVVDLYVAPDLAPLRELVAQTGGHLVGYEEQLSPALQALAARWLVWVEVPGEKPTDRLRRLQIETTRGEPLRTFRWAVSGTPPEIAAARRRLETPGG
jgi:hypothetical protein